MADVPTCPTCGAEIPADAPAGLCPKCLLREAFNSGEPSAGGETAATESHAGTPSPSFVPPLPSELAARFPQLEILELLGQGGMGAVYKARQPGLDRLVAVKILPPHAGQDPAFAERFAREARAMARLSHPHITNVYDFGQTDGLFFLVMEFVDGVNLRQAIRAGTVTPKVALEIVTQVCDALQYAHDEGVVHRDIKPENILLDRRGRVKIADFGLAKLLGADGAAADLTGTHQVMGTLRYMAPEQMEGSRNVDHRADIYSLGVVFYELLTGEVPMGRFQPPSEKVEIDVRIDEVVLKSLEREPERRYQHASEVKTAVDAVARSDSSVPLGRPADEQRDLDAAARTPEAVNVPRRSRFGEAWDAWWSRRDRWTVTAVQTLLVVIILTCLLAFLSYESKYAGGESVARLGEPEAWFTIESSPRGGGFGFNFLASSWLMALVAWAAAGIYFQIERTKANFQYELSYSWKFFIGMWLVFSFIGVVVTIAMNAATPFSRSYTGTVSSTTIEAQPAAEPDTDVREAEADEGTK